MTIGVGKCLMDGLIPSVPQVFLNSIIILWGSGLRRPRVPQREILPPGRPSRTYGSQSEGLRGQPEGMGGHPKGPKDQPAGLGVSEGLPEGLGG